MCLFLKSDEINSHFLHLIIHMKNTLIVGASSNPSRYAYLAAQRLTKMGHSIFLLGRRKGSVLNQDIHLEKINWPDIDTVTLYVNPSHQPEYYDYIISLKPKRVIFNPGTENPEFEIMLRSKNIIPVDGCTLVMLASGQY
jgi:predicted CoA-binding protein